MTNRKLKSGTGIGCTWIPGLPFSNKKWYDITIIFNIGEENENGGITYVTDHCSRIACLTVSGICRSLHLCMFFQKGLAWDETRKIELGKAYLKGTEFPAKEVYTVSSYDGYVLHAEYIETDPQSKKFVIISHGYTYTRYGSYKYVYLFQKLGFNCIIYDDRGHGRISGAAVCRNPGVERPPGND